MPIAYRIIKDRISNAWMILSLSLIIILPLVLGFGLYYKSSFLFHKSSLTELLFSSIWRPMSGRFGFLSFIISSIWITTLSIIISGPICLLTAIYFTQYAKKYVLKVMRPIIDILAGIPSVIFGVWGIIIIVPFVSGYVAPFAF